MALLLTRNAVQDASAGEDDGRRLHRVHERRRHRSDQFRRECGSAHVVCSTQRSCDAADRRRVCIQQRTAGVLLDRRTYAHTSVLRDIISKYDCC